MTQPLAAIRAHRVLPIEPDYPSVQVYRPSLRIVAKPLLTRCTGCDNDAHHIISDACRNAARNMLPLPCESVLVDEANDYRHDHSDMAGFVAPASTPRKAPMPVDVYVRRDAPVIHDIMAYLAESSPADSNEISDHLPQHERKVVINVLIYMAKRGLIYRAKPLVGQRYRTATYSLTPIRFETFAHTDGMSDRDREIVQMRLDGASLDGIAAKMGLSPWTVTNIVTRGIEECLVTES